MKFRPLHDRVVVKCIDAEEKSAGGIIIPDTAKEKPSQGDGSRIAEEGEPGNAGWWRHGWNGRNGLLIAPFILENNQAREFPGPFSCAAAKAGQR